MAEKSCRKPADVKSDGQKYSLAGLRAHSVELFDISTSTFDGAMYGCMETEMTVDEARARIARWLGKEG